MMSVDSLDAGLPQTFNLLKKKKKKNRNLEFSCVTEVSPAAYLGHMCSVKGGYTCFLKFYFEIILDLQKRCSDIEGSHIPFTQHPLMLTLCVSIVTVIFSG